MKQETKFFLKVFALVLTTILFTMLALAYEKSGKSNRTYRTGTVVDVGGTSSSWVSGDRWAVKIKTGNTYVFTRLHTAPINGQKVYSRQWTESDGSTYYGGNWSAHRGRWEESFLWVD